MNFEEKPAASIPSAAPLKQPKASRRDKIRISDLARELKTKAKIVIECLPNVGMTDKKTQSRFIDSTTAGKVRAYFLDQKQAGSSSTK